MDLRFAPSYNAHYIRRKGKNALGFFDTKDLLVVNGIADDLEKAGVKGIIKPSSTKNYKAIRLSEMKGKDLKTLTRTIARVLGIKAASKTAAVPRKKTGAQKKTPVTSGAEA